VHVLYERCAGIDVHKDQVTVAVRTPGDGPGGRQTQVRKFRAFYGVLTEMARWLVSLQVIPVGAGPVNPLAAFVFGFLRRGVGVLR
jgi:hypothetical protein